MKKIKAVISILIITAIGVVIMGFLSRGMKRTYANEVRSALGLYTQGTSDVLTQDDIETLPQPVQNYLQVVGAVGQPKVWNFRAEMGGRMRNDDKSAWMDIQSVQYNFFESPVRMFYIRGSMFKIPAFGLHSYKDEQGIMLIKALGIVPVVDQRGAEMNLSDTVTILNDMCVFAPASLIDPRISWDVIDDLTVKATFTNGGNKVSATLYFNDKGELVNFISDDRYRGYEKARWSTPISEYRKFGAFTLPAKALAMWHYPDREFSYAEFDINSIEYNCGIEVID